MTDRRIKILTFLLFAVFTVFLGRLFQLQIIEGKKNRNLAETNRLIKIPIPAPRGIIYDRHGIVLADNEPKYLVKDKEISREEGIIRQSEGRDADLKIVLQRKYRQSSMFAHSIGYLGEVTEKELSTGKLDLKGYGLGSWLGRVGIEAEYEEILKGRDGTELAEVDTQGSIVRRTGRILPTSGKALNLALDSKLQEVAAKELTGKKGAVIAQNPQNGEVFILYSSPSFDPNLFITKDNNNSLAKLITDEENRPLFNRVISGIFAPGSTFKIVTSTAGLEEKKITGNTLINDPGVLTVGAYKYANWYFTQYGRTEGEINVVRALIRSTDTFFYKLGEMVGPEKINFWAQKYNLDKIFGIDLPGEIPGFVGTPEWKKKYKNEGWFLGNTYHLAIGQGDIDLTPLAVNEMASVVANNGKYCTPRMLRLGTENTPYQAECKDTGVKKEYLDIIKRGMIGACETGGTAYPFFDFKPVAACKTGTAETGDGKTTHAWFTVFAPSENPTIVLTVLVERGGEGSTVAAPIAKEILKEYFKGK